MIEVRFICQCSTDGVDLASPHVFLRQSRNDKNVDKQETSIVLASVLLNHCHKVPGNESILE